ncbi:hypothetical protein HQ531_09250 [bacterium]|nr:hypothetical protein [bacterium]
MLLFSCEDKLVINTDKNTYYDDIADLTYLNGHFFTTNYDLSGHAGSQIDLLKYEYNVEHILISDSYDLDMNGQGYLAITNDGTDLYLQSRFSQLIVKSSAIGERAFLRADDIETNWQPSGLAYNENNDSLTALYRNLNDLSQYRIRTISKDISSEATRDELFQIDFVDTTYHGIYAMEYHDSNFYMLGVDTSQVDILITFDQDLGLLSTEEISDSTVVGLCFREDNLYFSYRDKRIELWGSY